MEIIKLIGKSRHGKNRVTQHGEHWQVISETPEELLIQSEFKTFVLNGEKSHDKRWVFKRNDPDFILIRGV